MNTFEQLENKDIVCIAFPTWEGNYVKSTVKIISELAKRNRVLYVDYEYTYKDLFGAWFGKGTAPAGRMMGFKSRLRKMNIPGGASVNVLTPPPVWSVNWIKSESFYDRMMRKNARIVRKSVLKAMRKLEMKNPVVINAFNPFFGVPLARTLNESALIYYCYDEISACKWSRVHGKRVEEKFIGMVDAVITSSEGLYEQKSQRTDKCFVVKNGVDFPLFNKAVELKRRTKSSEITVGYMGSVDERMDYDLLAHLVSSLPDIKFQVVGRITEPAKMAAVDKLMNIRFFGAKPVEELPQYLKNFDVAIIPFVKNQQTAAIYPVKLNEYLAAGVPVVATDFAPLSEFDGHILTASDKQLFLHAVNLSLSNDSVEKREARIELASQHSWEERGKQFGSVIASVMGKRTQAAMANVAE